MSTRTAALLAVLLVVAPLTALGAVGGVTGGTIQVDNGTTTISASGTGTVEAAPDQVVVRVASTARADSPAAAVAALNRNVSQLRTALREANVSDDAVRTESFDLFDQRTRNGTVFVARQSFAVTLDDTTAAGRIVDVAVENGATEVFGVAFTLSEETRRELRADAIDEAVTRARDDARAAARSAGLTITGVRSISVGNGGVGPFFERTADAGTQIDPSPVTVSATVSVTYNATSA